MGGPGRGPEPGSARAMAACRELDESWAEEATCPICLDFFSSPVSLACGHNFCRGCISRCADTQRPRCCPECRRELADVPTAVNWALASLAEKAQAAATSRTAKGRPLLCGEHGEKVKLFCDTDKALICLVCRDALEHKTHNFMPIKEAVGVYKEQLKSGIDSLTRKKAEFQEMERKQIHKIATIKGDARNLESRLASEFAEVHQILKKKEQCLIKGLQQEEKRIVSIVEGNLKEIQEHLVFIQKKLSHLQKQMDQKNGVTFLKEGISQKRSFSEIGQGVSVVGGNLSLENVKCTLPFAVWRELLGDIKSASVTLDTDTAHPELEISMDLRSVRWTGVRRNLHNSRKRFIEQFNALGVKGFTSGRHYWEVEVAGNRGWSLGVAAESVERKGRAELTPENGFWSIERYRQAVYTSSSSQSPLTSGPIPGTVGVYLSYESGTVSFYCADTKSHLHTFTGNKFTGKVYPFFHTGDGNWLRICSGSVKKRGRVPGLASGVGLWDRNPIGNRSSTEWVFRP
ncbi:LOW QUALITY PROTEIN: zinc-binding protein A33-like [Narcine bancroftii]|uniref:LOW QUALITY PROTEIN: zinc-binding protein A33-like n=1 Tax=Narcine bancroftii TaxID=1343680 RepID=UPI00383132D3